MRSRAAVSVMAIALLVLAMPASAQDEATTVSFDGVSFDFGPELGASVNTSRVPGQPTEPERPPFAVDAPHLTFTLYGSGREGGRTPRVGFTESTVRAYRIADLADYEGASAQLDALRGLLEDPSALEASMDVSDDGGVPLPHLPADVGAAQALRARAAYVESPELSGIVYLVGYRQDVSPFAAEDFFYTFQALSTDGAWYVSGDFVIEATMFPEEIRPREARGFPRRFAPRLGARGAWLAYLEESIQTLNAASPEAFSPPLTDIDALIGSITFEPTTTGATGDA
jgi:hypothetical protein